jgi:hypothetical protein
MRTYHVKCRDARHTHRWFICSQTLDPFCYYEHEKDAWEFAKALARKAGCIAVRHNEQDNVVERVSYVIAEGATVPAKAKRRRAG